MHFVEGDTFVVSDVFGVELYPKKIYVSDFSISETPVTVGQFAAFVKETGHITFKERYVNGEFKYYINQWNDTLKFIFFHKKATWKTDDNGNVLKINMPVVNVSFDDIYAYCQWLSGKIGKKIELPTESEWYFAALGGKLSKNYYLPGSDNVSDVYPTTNVEEMKRDTPFPVKQKIKNELGLYDFLGNVFQIVTGNLNRTEIETNSNSSTLFNPGRKEFSLHCPHKLQIKNSTIIKPEIKEVRICGNPSFLVDGESKFMAKFKFNESSLKLNFGGLLTNMAWTGSGFIGFRVVFRSE